MSQVCNNIQGKHATTCKGWTYTKMDSSLLGPTQWPICLGNAGKCTYKHACIHGPIVKHKETTLSTLKRGEHGHMASIVSSEIMLEKVPNQLNKSSKA